jgi:hypothetical protein
MSSSTSPVSTPDSNAVVTSLDTASQFSRARVSAYRRAFCSATPAAAARASSTASSSAVNCAPPRFSVR